jgi:hypothetical protein
MPDDARWAANTWQFVATMGLAELLGGNPHHTTTEDHISPLINDATCAHIGMTARIAAIEDGPAVAFSMAADGRRTGQVILVQHLALALLAVSRVERRTYLCRGVARNRRRRRYFDLRGVDPGTRRSCSS